MFGKTWARGFLAVAVVTIASALTTAASYGQGPQVDMARHNADVADRNAFFAKIEQEHKKNLEAGRSLFGADERWEKAVETPAPAPVTTASPTPARTAPPHERKPGKPLRVKPPKPLPAQTLEPQPERDILLGTLAGKSPLDFKIDDWGCMEQALQVIHKISKTECLVIFPADPGFWNRGAYRFGGGYDESEPMLLRGLDMSKVTDGAKFILQHPVWIDGTYDYTNVSGARKTILVLDHNAEKLKKFETEIEAKAEAKQQDAIERAKAKQDRKDAIEAAKWRTWTDATGEHHIEARLGGVSAGNVKLTKRDGTVLTMPLEKLSDEDQEWIKKRSK